MYIVHTFIHYPLSLSIISIVHYVYCIFNIVQYTLHTIYNEFVITKIAGQVLGDTESYLLYDCSTRMTGVVTTSVKLTVAPHQETMQINESADITLKR